MRAALTIAGSDSIAGAGIQADLKTFAALGVYGASAITAVTSQNTTGVDDVFVLPSQTVLSQITAVMEDVQIFAVKTGMLATADIVRVVAGALAGMEQRNLVVDPVTVSSQPGRSNLLTPEGVLVLKAELLPLALVVTPNVAEASALSGIEVTSRETARDAAKRIFDLGPRAVVVKGGHLAGPEAIDLLYDGSTFTEFASPRAPGGPIHGTGCTFASAIAAGVMAKGDELPEAVARAKRYVSGAIAHASSFGRGSRLLNHFWNQPSPPGFGQASRGYTDGT